MSSDRDSVSWPPNQGAAIANLAQSDTSSEPRAVASGHGQERPGQQVLEVIRETVPPGLEAEARAEEAVELALKA